MRRRFPVPDRTRHAAGLNGSAQTKGQVIYTDVAHALQVFSGGMGGPVLPSGPFADHAWVFAAAFVRSIAASQAPFRVFRETEEMLAKRLKEAQFLGVPSTVRYGKNRTAIVRHLDGPARERVVLRGLEPLPAHPLTPLLKNPNPLQSGMQFFFTLFIWLSTRGHGFVVMESEDGGSVSPGRPPARMWALSPDLFQPILKDVSSGELVGWRFCVPNFMSRDYGPYVDLPTSDVIHVKFPHPENPLTGLSPISAVARSIELDNMATQYNRALILNGGEPSGVIFHETTMSQKEEDDYMRRFDQRYKGTKNRGRTAILTGGFKYQPTGLSPQDMNHIETKKWGREEILSAMNTPRSILGLTEYVNYATQIGQDGNFWEHTILPCMRVVESAFDYTLFAEEPDTIVAAFDTRNVEALRAGLTDKVDVCVKLCGPELRVPPRVAYGVVGLEVPAYEGDDKTSSDIQAEQAQAQMAADQAMASAKRPTGDQNTDGSGQSVGGRADARPQPQASPDYSGEAKKELGDATHERMTIQRSIVDGFVQLYLEDGGLEEDALASALRTADEMNERALAAAGGQDFVWVQDPDEPCEKHPHLGIALERKSWSDSGASAGSTPGGGRPCRCIRVPVS